MRYRRGLIVAAAGTAAVLAVPAIAGDGRPRPAGPAPFSPGPDLILADQKRVTALAYSPDGRLLAVAGEGGLRLWETATGTGTRELVGAGSATGNGITSVAFAPDGRVVAGGDRTGRIRLWNVADGTPAGEFGPHDDVREVAALAYAPDGRTLAAAGRLGPVVLWDVTGDRVRTLTGAEQTTSQSAALAFSPDGRRIVLVRYSRGAMVWDVATGEQAEDLAIGPTEVDGHRANTVAFAPHGSTVALGGWAWLRLVDPVAGRTRDLVGHEAEVASVAFAPDGRTLVSVGGFYDGSARLWDVRTGSQRRLLCDRVGCGGVFSQVVFSPDGHSVAAVQPWVNQVRVWRV